jgi:hypothetical protein
MQEPAAPSRPTTRNRCDAILDRCQLWASKSFILWGRKCSFGCNLKGPPKWQWSGDGGEPAVTRGSSSLRGVEATATGNCAEIAEDLGRSSPLRGVEATRVRALLERECRLSSSRHNGALRPLPGKTAYPGNPQTPTLQGHASKGTQDAACVKAGAFLGLSQPASARREADAFAGRPKNSLPVQRPAR